MKRLVFSVLILFAAALSSCKDKIEAFEPGEIENKGPEGSSIPFFVINSLGNTIVDEPKVRGTLSVFVDQELVFSNRIGIELRGSTSRRLFPKKSYGIEFWDEAGQDVSLEILDFGKEEDWVLYGPYSDKTLLRNKLIYDLSNDIGQYAAKTKLVEVELDGVFRGTYVFMEKLKRDGDRLTIEPMDASVTSGEELTGGYILKIDKTGGDTEDSDWSGDAAYTEFLSFRSNYASNGQAFVSPLPYSDKQGYETYFLYEYPRPENINTEQKSYIQEYIQSFEDALANEDFSGTTRAYEDYIDVDSFVDFFILNELSANPDAYRLSTYMHKFRNGKLRMGPIWDFNLAFGNDGRSSSFGWIYQYNTLYPNDLWLVHFWYPKLMQDPQFRAAIKARWNELKNSTLSPQNIESKIDEMVTTLDENGALTRNFEQWPVIGEELPFNSFVGNSYAEEITYMKNWISERINWMNTKIQVW